MFHDMYKVASEQDTNVQSSAAGGVTSITKSRRLQHLQGVLGWQADSEEKEWHKDIRSSTALKSIPSDGVVRWKMYEGIKDDA